MKLPPPNQTDIIAQMMEEGKFDLSTDKPVPMESLRSYLNKLMGMRSLSVDVLADLSSRHRSSVYRILNGQTAPTRNMLLSFAFVLELSFKETQQLLKCGGCAQLTSSKDSRDLIIMDSLIKKQSLGDTDERLRAAGHMGLFKS